MLGHLREEVCNTLLSLEMTGPWQFVLGTGAYPGTIVVDDFLDQIRNIAALKKT
jgi:hypothetical protein